MVLNCREHEEDSFIYFENSSSASEVGTHRKCFIFWMLNFALLQWRILQYYRYMKMNMIWWKLLVQEMCWKELMMSDDAISMNLHGSFQLGDVVSSLILKGEGWVQKTLDIMYYIDLYQTMQIFTLEMHQWISSLIKFCDANIQWFVDCIL